jgi:plasmid stabilization system protein ParE
VSQLRIGPRASSDLIEIWSYIADDSVANADAFIDKLYRRRLAVAATDVGRVDTVGYKLAEGKGPGQKH